MNPSTLIIYSLFVKIVSFLSNSVYFCLPCFALKKKIHSETTFRRSFLQTPMRNLKIIDNNFRKEKHTVGLFFYLECDRLPGHLQEMDGFAQWLSFKTDPTDGQDSVPYMYGPSPAGFGEQRRQRYQNIPDSTGRRDGKPVRLPVC